MQSSPASPLFPYEECGCLKFMGQEGKTHSDFPTGTQVIPYVHPPANLSPAGSCQQLFSIMGNVPLTPQLQWHQISLGESLHPLRTKPAWCAEGFLPPFAFRYLSSPLLQKWEPGFPMSRRRDTDHSRLSPLPSPTENNHRRLDWPIIQEVEKSARKAAWRDNPAKATLQRVLWGTVYG